MGEIAERLVDVRERALSVYRRVDHAPLDELHIVCVTKMQPVPRILEAIHAGATEIGENYLQEAVRKNVFSLRTDFAVTIRYIGRLQSNKYNAITRNFDSVDSTDPGLLEKLPLIRSRGECRSKVFLLEVNAGDETQKGGLTIAQIQELGAARSSWLAELSGLMVVVPLSAGPAARAIMYDDVHNLFCQLRHDLGASHFRFLSMGTSDDFELALEHGSNMIRVGTAIFGVRPPQQV